MKYINIIAQAAPAEAGAVTTQPASTPADAAAADAQAQGGGYSSIIMIVLMIVIFYFVLIRPQKKQQKELKDRQDSLKSGDKVVTAGGIFGIVREVKDSTVKLEIAPNTVIKIARTSIVQSVGKDGAAEGK